MYQKERKKETVSAFNSALINDISKTELIAYIRKENESAQKHEREMLQMQMQINLQIHEVLLENVRVHPLQLQSVTPQSYQQLSKVITSASTSFNQYLLQRNQYANCSFQNMASDFSSSLLSIKVDITKNYIQVKKFTIKYSDKT